MNEYRIRNGFSEKDAPKILTMNADLRDYVNNEYGGRARPIMVYQVTKRRKRLPIFRSKKGGSRRSPIFEDGKPEKL